MYADNVFSKRRPGGWVERKRRFERLTAQVVRGKAVQPKNDTKDTTDKPKR
jgi:hypothetical protein